MALADIFSVTLDDLSAQPLASAQKALGLIGAYTLIAGTPILWTAGLLGLGGTCGMVNAWRPLNRLSLLPTSRIRSAAQGEVELVGRAQRPSPDQGRFADEHGAPLVWATIDVWATTRSVSGQSRREVVDRYRSDETICIDDGTGSAEVFPPAVISGARSFRWGSWSPVVEPPPWQASILSRIGRLFAPYAHHMQYVSHNETLTVIGAFTTYEGSGQHVVGGRGLRVLCGSEDSVRQAAKVNATMNGVAAATAVLAGFLGAAPGGDQVHGVVFAAMTIAGLFQVIPYLTTRV